MLTRAIVCCLFLFGCQKMEASCVTIKDAITKNKLLEILKPGIEFKREIDGYHYTMEIHLKFYDVSFNNCEGLYKVKFTPKSEDDINGSPVLGYEIEHHIDMNKKKVVDFISDGLVKH